MKKIFTLIALIVFVTSGALAQSQKMKQKEYKPSHNVRVGWGAGQIIFGPSMFDYNRSHSVGPEYCGPKYTTGTISAEYTYQPNRWLEIGANLAYLSHYSSYFDRVTDQKQGTQHRNFFGMMLTARFNYLNKGIWRLYGQISLGAAVEMTGYTAVDGATNQLSQWHPNFQITPIGLAVGKKYYGFLELPAIGSLGVINAGFGIRF